MSKGYFQGARWQCLVALLVGQAKYFEIFVSLQHKRTTLLTLATVVVETSDFDQKQPYMNGWVAGPKSFKILVSWQHKRTILLTLATVDVTSEFHQQQLYNNGWVARLKFFKNLVSWYHKKNHFTNFGYSSCRDFRFFTSNSCILMARWLDQKSFKFWSAGSTKGQFC